MKKTLLLFIIAAAGSGARAQELAPDQNPNYKKSMEKYHASHDNLQSTMNTTVQSTYKAYDWTTNKAERRAKNREYRRESYGYNNYNNGYYSPYNNRYNYYQSPYQQRYNGWYRHW